MKKLIRAAIVSFSLLVSHVSYAANVWVNNLKVTQVEASPGGSFLLTFDKNLPSQCTSAGLTRTYFQRGQNSVTSEGLQSLERAALVAKLTGALVNIYINTSTGACYGNRILLK